jgi:hypothetical protein
MSEKLPAVPAAARKTPASKPAESQRLTELEEKFDDKKLAQDVAVVSDFIAK